MTTEPKPPETPRTPVRAPIFREDRGKAILLGSLVATTMALLAGALIAVSTTHAQFGVTMFVTLPIAVGLTCACFVVTLRAGFYAVMISVALSCLVLLFTALEGVLCICLALPIIVGGAMIGACVGTLLREATRQRKKNFAVLPMIGFCGVFGSGVTEERLVEGDRVEVVTSTLILDTTPESAWATIASVDSISGEKPWLFRLGLPVPQRCTLDGDGVGATRTCWFESGVIEERVTRWDPPRQLEMTIVRTTLPGRHWLGFVAAAYTIEPLPGGQVQITRSTTIRSRLRPAAYWRFFERLGVQAEHDYLFESLKRR